MWFVYTLVLVRLLYQLPLGRYSRIGNILLCTLFLATIQWMNHKGIYLQNAIANVMLAYPFYIIGVIISKQKKRLNGISRKLSAIILISGIGITYWVYKQNGPVFLFMNHCGKNVLMCILGGISGSAIIFGFSKLIAYDCTWIRDISNGTLAILGLHSIVICVFKMLYPIATLGIWNWLTAVVVMSICCCFIMIGKTRFPYLLGMKK